MPEEYFVPQVQMDMQRQYIALCKEALPVYFQKEKPVCFLHTYGCQGNVADSQRLKRLLYEMGFSFTDHYQEADFALLNTCAVRENAHDHVFGNLGMLTHNKERNKKSIIGMCGCMAQQEEVAQKIKKSYPAVDLIFGTHVFYRLPEFLYCIISGKEKRVFSIEPSAGVIAEEISPFRDHRYIAFIPIMYGCDNFCSYCIVPYVKGRERSRRYPDILDEVKEALKKGYKEILLLGQNVNSYGKGLKEPISFAELLWRIQKLPYDFRIRFMTSHPKDISRELLDSMAGSEKICKHLHLPLQSGSNRILKEMNRGYTVKDYLDLVRYAREKMPNISLTSDIIVGFPGERQEDFLNTLQVVKDVRFDSLFTFLYSRRAYTRASTMSDPVSEKEKKRWLQTLIDEQYAIGLKNRAKYLGTVQRILVEGESKTEKGFFMGKTDTHLSVQVKGSSNIIGRFIDVQITSADKMTLEGKQIERNEKYNGYDTTSEGIGEAITANRGISGVYAGESKL